MNKKLIIIVLVLFVASNSLAQNDRKSLLINHRTPDNIQIRIEIDWWWGPVRTIQVYTKNIVIEWAGTKYGRGNKLQHNGKVYEFPMNCSDCIYDISGSVTIDTRSYNFQQRRLGNRRQERIDPDLNHNEIDQIEWENNASLDSPFVKASNISGAILRDIRAAVAAFNSSPESQTTSASNSTMGKRNWNGQAHVAHVAELERKAKNKSGDKSNGLSRDEFHKQHVQQNNAAYYERVKQKKSNDNASMKEFQQQQEQKTSNIIEEQEQKRREYYEELEQRRIAQIEKQRIENERMDRAATQAAQQIQGGNYVGAGMTLAQEAANQGSAGGAAVAAGAGIVAQIFHDAAKEKERKRQEEARRLERERIARERERKRQALLASQKREFNALVDEIRRGKKAIIRSRENFLNSDISYTKTYDKFAKNGEPIYLFFTETNKNYNSYKENVSFPNTMEITIEDKVELRFSPIIAIYPNSSGEYPYLKDLFAQLETEYFKKSTSHYKLYNWRGTLPEIQKLYSAVSEKALKSNFIPKIPSGELLVEFNKSQNSESDDAYWANEQPISPKTSGDDYWSSDTKDQESVSKQPQKPNYWSTSVEMKTDSLSIPRVDEKSDYWSEKKKQDSIPDNFN
ncbi:hypothetical protein [Christiangramia crocea]|uniref:Uncharacterized protein n=1 Tax=Christiangramia crocea TaxID=2904124 RepID=A0A9X2A6T1_9FLAO|nr:hypothetical protein [Gramella crocea]MCG9970787.1 hypothetical protein [Gramella crocea]